MTRKVITKHSPLFSVCWPQSVCRLQFSPNIQRLPLSRRLNKILDRTFPDEDALCGQANEYIYLFIEINLKSGKDKYISDELFVVKAAKRVRDQTVTVGGTNVTTNFFY